MFDVGRGENWRKTVQLETFTIILSPIFNTDDDNYLSKI